jgi:tetratricopeptide (TPR) repeat protein
MAGEYARQAGQMQPAIDAYERAAQLGGLSEQGWLALGQAYHAVQQDEAALKAWDTGAALHAPAPELLQAAIDLRLEQGNLGSAERSLKALAGLEPRNATRWRTLGLIQLALDPPSALSALDQAANLDAQYAPLAQAARRVVISARASDDPAYKLVIAGRALAGQGEWGLAYQAFARATALRPDYAEAWAYLGEAMQHPGQGSLLPLPNQGLSAGMKELDTALALEPDSLSGLTFMALFWTRQGRPERAVGLLQQAVQQQPDNASLQAQLADALARSGDLAGADAAYRGLAQAHAGEVLYRRLWISFMLDYSYQVRPIALDAARQLVIDFPDDPAALDTLGQALVQVNDLENARRTFERAVQLGPDYAPAYLHLGQVELLLGDAEQARTHLNQVLALEPHGPLAPLAKRLLESIPY